MRSPTIPGNSVSISEGMSGRVLLLYGDHTWSIDAAKFSPDGSRKLTGDLDIGTGSIVNQDRRHTRERGAARLVPSHAGTDI